MDLCPLGRHSNLANHLLNCSVDNAGQHSPEMAVLRPPVGLACTARCLWQTHPAIWIALVDFGTAKSSLSQLRDFPVSTVKIGRSFTSKATDEPEVAAIVSPIHDLAAILGMETVAEGIENPGPHHSAETRGTPFRPGYLFSRAVRGKSLPFSRRATQRSRRTRIALQVR